MAGGSRAPYIIICNARIEVALSRNGYEMIRAASNGASDLVCYFGDRLSHEDTEPISKLQHEMMDLVQGNAPSRKPAQAGAMVDEMFALLDALEQRMES